MKQAWFSDTHAACARRKLESAPNIQLRDIRNIMLELWNRPQQFFKFILLENSKLGKEF